MKKEFRQPAGVGFGREHVPGKLKTGGSQPAGFLRRGQQALHGVGQRHVIARGDGEAGLFVPHNLRQGIDRAGDDRQPEGQSLDDRVGNAVAHARGRINDARREKNVLRAEQARQIIVRNKARHAYELLQPELSAQGVELLAHVAEPERLAAAARQGEPEVDAPVAQQGAGAQEDVKALGDVETPDGKETRGRVKAGEGRDANGGKGQAVVDEPGFTGGMSAGQSLDARLVGGVVGADEEGFAQFEGQVGICGFEIVAARGGGKGNAAEG